MAYSDGDVREAVEAQGTELVAKVPPTINSGRFPKTEFTCGPGCRDGHLPGRGDHRRCPAGQRPQGPVGHYVLFRRPPPVKFARCGSVAPPGKAGAPSWWDGTTAAPRPPGLPRANRRPRHYYGGGAKVERKIDHLQDLGMRKARYRGRRKTRLQAYLAATVANLKRLAVLGVFQTAPLAMA